MRNLGGFLQRTAERWRAAAELGTLESNERRRVLEELGLDPAQLPALIAGADNPRRLLTEMMRRFELEPAAVPARQRGVLADMQRVCAVCPVHRRCAKALAAGADRQACSAFCPNADTLAALAAEAVGTA